MPWSLAAWNILPSTSILTALVHSSKSANFGLMEIERSEGVEGRREKGEGKREKGEGRWRREKGEERREREETRDKKGRRTMGQEGRGERSKEKKERRELGEN